MKNVLFVCVGNTCRSQMAEGFARKLGKDVMRAASAGTNATGFVSPKAVQVMREEGVNISGQHSRQLTRRMIQEADLVVALGGHPESLYPDLLQDKLITWPTPDPFGGSLYDFRRVRDRIKGKVVDLIIDLARPGKA
jgi:protein-tyrosine-phosphatase